MGDLQEFWQRITGDESTLITESTVEVLEGRCPALSESDRQHLQHMMDEKQFLSHLGHESKARVFADAANYFRTVPSFHTFFEDLKYVMICCDVHKSMLWGSKMPKHDTLREGFSKIFHFQGQLTTQTGPEEFLCRPCNNRDDAFLWAYCQQWLCVMRLWPYMLTQRPRKDPRLAAERRELVLNTRAYRALVANTAQRLGFFSDRIRDLASATLPPAQRPERDSHSFVVMGEAVSYSIEDRCGIPLESTTDVDRDCLFINRLLQPDVSPGHDINSLFVRRVLFQRLFPESVQICRHLMRDSPTFQAENLVNSSRPEPATFEALALTNPPNHVLGSHETSLTTATTTIFGPYEITVYYDIDQVQHESLSLQARLDRARQLQQRGYLLMTGNLRHLEPSSIGDFRGREVIAIDGGKVDIRVLRDKKGLGARSGDPDVMVG